MNLTGSSISCGVWQMGGINWDGTPQTILTSFMAARRTPEAGYYGRHLPKKAFVLFSDNKMGRGLLLSEYIQQNGLGTISETEWVKNPNSGRDIRVWVWTPNYTKLTSWARKKNK